MTDPGAYPPSGQAPRAGPPADQPTPDQASQAGPPTALPPWELPPAGPPAGQPPPEQPLLAGPPAGQPPLEQPLLAGPPGQPPGRPYMPWTPPDPYGARPPAAPLPPWPSAAPPPPWSPPAAGQPTLWPPPPAGPVHRPLAGQAAALTVLLAAIAAANLVAGVAASLSRIVWGSVEFGELLLHLLVIPVFLVWFYRARKNADDRGQEQRWGPGWAIGAWVTPFVNFWFPYQIMADIWRANLPAERRANTAWLPGFWWGCWIAGDIFGLIALASARTAPGLHSVASILVGLSAAAAAILLIVVVRVITRGPVGRAPVAAQPGLAPQDGVAGPGLVYPQMPAYDGGGHLAAGVGYALSALAVVIAAALMAAAIAGQSIRTTPVAGRTPAPVTAGTSTAAPAPAVQQVTPDQLRAGDCIKGPADINTASTWPDLISVVPCTRKHLAEVFYSANYWPVAMAFPGNAVINKQAHAKCLKAFSAYDGSMYSESQYTYYGGNPRGRQDWNSGDRLLTCVAYFYRHGLPRGKPLYASIRGSDQ
jgi:hypothetical protein